LPGLCRGTSVNSDKLERFIVEMLKNASSFDLATQFLMKKTVSPKDVVSIAKSFEAAVSSGNVPLVLDDFSNLPDAPDKWASSSPLERLCTPAQWLSPTLAIMELNRPNAQRSIIVDYSTAVLGSIPLRRKPAAPSFDYSQAGETSAALFAIERHPEIKGYRGRPGGDLESRFWNPQKPPCVPSDDRPQHLFCSREAAEAAGAASQVERFEPPPYDDEHYKDKERYELALVNHKQALRRLRKSFPDVEVCPLAHTSHTQHQTRPCPCGRGVLARWPWVVQTAQLGFCGCKMAGWELTCWRIEWVNAAVPDFAS